LNGCSNSIDVQSGNTLARVENTRDMRPTVDGHGCGEVNAEAALKRYCPVKGAVAANE
jgi:hypothetical protein